MDKVTITDSLDVILKKINNVNKNIDSSSKSLRNKEIDLLKKISEKLNKVMITEKFSGKNGFLIYEFVHDDRNKEDYYISPRIYLTPDFTIVYKVSNNGKYLECSPNSKLFIGKNNIVYCECSVAKILDYVTLKEILNFIEESLNRPYSEYNNISERLNFINTFNQDNQD